MTVNKNLAEFAAALDKLVESAASCVRDPDAFLSANRDIETLIGDRWQAISSELAASELTPEERILIQDLSAALAGLETQASARLVWAADFDEYMRNALAPQKK